MLTSNAQFRPFSYDEIVKPLIQQTQAQQDIENQYGDLSTQANVWKGLANQQTDPKAYATYSNYADQLAQARDSLVSNGLNDSSRNTLMNMKSQYASDIIPIKNAYERRQTLADEQRKMLEQNPTLLFSKDASQMSLDDLIKNPAASYNSTSGALITQQVATAANALAKEIQNNPNSTKYRSILGDSYYELAKQQGFSSQAVMQAIANSPNASPILKGIVERAVNSSGIKNWGDNDSINRAYDYAKQGLWNAVGTTQYQTLENWRAKMAAEEQMQKDLIDYKTKPQEQAGLSQWETQNLVNGIGLKNNAGVNIVDKYFNTVNGRKVLKPEFAPYFSGNKLRSDKDMEAYISSMAKSARSSEESNYLNINGARLKSNYNELKSIMGNLGLNPSKNTFVDLNNRMTASSNNSTSGVGIYKYGTFRYMTDDELSKLLKNRALSAGTSSIREVTGLNDDSSDYRYGNSLKVADLNDKDSNITQTNYNPILNKWTFTIKDKDGNTKWYSAPKGFISSTIEDYMTRGAGYLKAASPTQKVKILNDLYNRGLSGTARYYGKYNATTKGYNEDI
jgi:hypothetical protein